MKTIRNILIPAGLSLMFLALGATRVRTQVITMPVLTGSFTLPVEAHWGGMTLPAGDYTLLYGIQDNGHGLVVVWSTAKGSPYGMILAGRPDSASAGRNVLKCVREGGTLYVRALEMPVIGESVPFKIPHAVEVQSKVIAKNHSQSGKTQFAEVVIRIQAARMN